jgi:hypothetical protein
VPRVCTVCTHPERDRVDAALIGSAESKSGIARKYAIDDDAIRRHAARHLSPELKQAAGAVELTRLESLIADLRRLWERAQQLGEDAEREGDRRAALTAIRESRDCLQLLAKFTGDLDERPQVNVLLAPEWRTVQVVILEALDEHPAARTAVTQALLRLEAGAA